MAVLYPTLTFYFSIGNKKNNLHVVFTPWTNLKKTQGMEDGQVGFHKQHLVRQCRLRHGLKRLDITRPIR